MAETRSQFLARIGQPVGGKGRALKYDPDHCERILVLARGGAFPEAWASEIGVSCETFRLWGKRYPEFREALVMAHQNLLSYWTRELVHHLNNPKARPGLYALLTRRFSAIYGSDPVDLVDWMLDVPDEGDPPPPPSEPLHNLTTEELLRRLEVLQARRRAAQG